MYNEDPLIEPLYRHLINCPPASWGKRVAAAAQLEPAKTEY